MTVRQMKRHLQNFPDHYTVVFMGLNIDKVLEDINEETDEWECTLYSDEYIDFLHKVIENKK